MELLRKVKFLLQLLLEQKKKLEEMMDLTLDSMKMLVFYYLKQER